MSMKMKHLLLAAEGGESASAPSAAPTPAPAAPAAPVSTETGGDAVDWSAMNEDVDPGADDEEEESETPVLPDVTVAHESDATTETPTTQEKPAELPATPIPETLPEPEPAQTAAQNAELQRQFAEWEQAQLTKLEAEYAFDDEAASRLQTEPELVLPKLAARMQMSIMKQTLEAVQRMIPQMVPPVLQKQSNDKAAADMFYGKNPDLRDHHDAVMAAGVMFRKMNPKAGPEEAAEKIGNIVRSGLGLATRSGTPVEPAPKAKPHRPVGPGGGSKGVAPKVESSVWADLAGDDD